MTEVNARALQALEQEAEKRRQAAAKKAQVPLPKGIKSIEQTEVVYVVDPDILPFSLVDPVEFFRLLEEKYRLKYSRPSVNEALQQFGLNPQALSDSDVFKLSLAAGEPRCRFTSGRYPTGPNSFVSINSVLFTGETILVNVDGRTVVAEAVAADAFDLLWQSSGAIKTWGSPEVQSCVALKSYGTRTEVDLGCNPRLLLNPTVVQFLDDNINVGRKYGSAMMSYSGFDDFKPSPANMAIWTFDELHLQVHIFNQITGRQETHLVKFVVTQKEKRGRDIVEVTTELPFDLHADLVGQIIDVVGKAET